MFIYVPPGAAATAEDGQGVAKGQSAAALTRARHVSGPRQSNKPRAYIRVHADAWCHDRSSATHR